MPHLQQIAKLKCTNNLQLFLYLLFYRPCIVSAKSISIVRKVYAYYSKYIQRIEINQEMNSKSICRAQGNLENNA